MIKTASQRGRWLLFHPFFLAHCVTCNLIASTLRAYSSVINSCVSDRRHHNRHRDFFDGAAQSLGVRTIPDDWYNVPAKAIRDLPGGSALLSRYKNSLVNALLASYPEVDWKPWQFSTTSVPRRFWDALQNQRKFFDWAGERLGVQTHQDWYRISVDDIKKLGGGSILSLKYNNSLFAALCAIYPESQWYPWKFQRGHRGLWDDISNQRKFFDWIASEKLHIRQPHDWYKTSLDDVYRHGGYTLVHHYYKGSLSAALLAVYPEIDWQPWRFPLTPKHFWESIHNQRRFMDWVAEQLQIGSTETTNTNQQQQQQQQQQQVLALQEGWYKVSPYQVRELGGSTLLSHHYGSSLAKALQSIYPEVEWQPWRFEYCYVPKSESTNEEHLKRYFDYLTNALRIQHLDEWYRVSMDQIQQVADGSHNIIRRHGGLVASLKKAFPHHDWKEAKFAKKKGKRASQRLLRVVVGQLLPNQEVHEEYIHKELRFAKTGEPISFDIFVPALSLAFEFHGKQHFGDVYLFGPQSHVQERDREKLAAAKAHGITLVIVPFWWDRTKETLAETIASVRPDLRALLETNLSSAEHSTITPQPSAL